MHCLPSNAFIYHQTTFLLLEENNEEKKYTSISSYGHKKNKMHEIAKCTTTRLTFEFCICFFRSILHQFPNFLMCVKENDVLKCLTFSGSEVIYMKWTSTNIYIYDKYQLKFQHITLTIHRLTWNYFSIDNFPVRRKKLFVQFFSQNTRVLQIYKTKQRTNIYIHIFEKM